MNKSFPPVAAIVLSWNRRAEVLKTVALLLQDDYPALEVLVVDNASSDGTQEALGHNHPEVRLIALPDNRGVSARDVGMRATDAEYVALFDDDSAPDPGAIARMVALFEANPHIAIIPFNVYGGAHPTAHMARLLPVDLVGFHASGAGLRRRAALTAGGSDHDFFWGAEEWDLALRILNDGWEIMFDPAIWAHHRTSALHRSNRRLRTQTARNETWIALKYFPLKRIPVIVCRIVFWNAVYCKLEGLPALWHAPYGAARALWSWRVPWRKRQPIRPEILARYERSFTSFSRVGLRFRIFVGRRLPARTPLLVYRILFWKANVPRYGSLAAVSPDDARTP